MFSGYRPLLARPLLLFVAVLLVELAVLFWIAQETSWLFAIALVIAAGVLGAALARLEGLRCLRAAQQQAARGELPTDSLLDGLLVLLAGALLIMPGVLTDLVGLALLIPPIRRVVRRRLARWMGAHLLGTSRPGASWDGRRDEIVDVRVIDVPARELDKD